ncbi:MAG: hypothetical protein K6G03_07220 [Lachnospiraceae bacterium]|nr:hypothetical protein [Lachnospiraceae bacterium]
MVNNSKYKKEFLYKKSYLDRRLQTDVMENGVAYIPCKVKGIDSIISEFSVKGCESLDTDFLTFIIDFAEFIPTDYPVVLRISGAKFTPEEKKTISDTVAAEMDYILGRTEEFINIRRRRFYFMIFCTVLSGIILFIAMKMFEGVPLEFFYVLFWLFADTIVRYLFIDKLDFKEEKIHMGRLASMTVEFAEPEE